jgi:hypothetical protein
MKITREQLKNIVREVMTEESEYQTFFKKALEKTGKSIPQMSDEEKKAFFNKIDTAWKGKGEKREQVEELTKAQEKLPPALKKAIEKNESVNEGKFKSLERDVKNLASTVKVDFSEALEVLQDDGVLEAMDHLEHAIERIKDVHKILKRKS